RVNALGRVRPLPEIIEENLLRVAQEALTNVIKHAAATRATITLDYGLQSIRLHIQDNGAGFVPDNHAGPRDGHFGLLGITERTNRLRGDFSVGSQPGKGTSLQVTIPTAPLPVSASIRNQFGT